jgi:hypothetical protein
MATLATRTHEIQQREGRGRETHRRFFRLRYSNIIDAISKGKIVKGSASTGGAILFSSFPISN